MKALKWIWRNFVVDNCLECRQSFWLRGQERNGSYCLRCQNNLAAEAAEYDYPPEELEAMRQSAMQTRQRVLGR